MMKATILVLALLFLAELSAGYLNFQRGSEQGIALLWLVDRVKQRVSNQPLEVETSSSEASFDVNSTRYSEIFAEGVYKLMNKSCQLLVVYVPTIWSNHKEAREYFTSLSKVHSIPLLDMSIIFSHYPKQVLFLTPFDEHPTRFASYLIAKEINDWVKTNEKLSCVTEGSAPTGLLPPNMTEVRETYAGLAIRLSANELGFRRSFENERASKTMLILGDSFVFGTSLPDSSHIAAHLNFLNNKWAAINAGIPGTSIRKQLELHQKLTGNFKPNLTILIINDTDLLNPES